LFAREIRGILCISAGVSVFKNVGKDAWGTAYRAVAFRDGFHILSAGPDRKWKTRDDLKLYQVLVSGNLEGQ